MSDLRIDISDLTPPAAGDRAAGRGGPDQRGGDARKGRGSGVRCTALRWLRRATVLVLLAVLPFVLLIRGGVWAYTRWGLGTWPSLAVAVGATALLLAAYGWLLTRRLGGGVRARKAVVRAAVGVAVAYAVYGLVFVAGENVKSEAVRAEYVGLHPLLRLATSALILVDPGAVVTDAGRTPEEYRRMGLPPREASLHFQQPGGWVHALDLRTVGRPEWRNRAVDLGFRVMGFRSLRHVGTADHLHLSLPPAG